MWMPAAKLLGDNAEQLFLASHQQAIHVQQEQAVKTDALPATPEAVAEGVQEATEGESIPSWDESVDLDSGDDSNNV